MGLILDLLIISLAIIFIINGYKNGLFKSFINILGVVSSLAISTFLAKHASEIIYKTFVHDYLTNKINNSIYSNATVVSKSQDILGIFPKFIVEIFNYNGLSLRDVENTLKATSQNASSSIIELFKPTIVNLISNILLIIFLALFFILLKFITKHCKFTKVPIIGKADAILGASFGLIKYFILLIVLFNVFYFLFPIFFSSSTISTNELIDQTFILKYIKNYQFNFFNY